MEIKVILMNLKILKMSNKEMKILMGIQEDLLKLNGRNLSQFTNWRRSEFQEQLGQCLKMVSKWIKNEQQMIKDFGSDE